MHVHTDSTHTYQGSTPRCSHYRPTIHVTCVTQLSLYDVMTLANCRHKALILLEAGRKVASCCKTRQLMPEVGGEDGGLAFFFYLVRSMYVGMYVRTCGCVCVRTGVLAKVCLDVVTGAPSGSPKSSTSKSVTEKSTMNSGQTPCTQNTLYTNIFNSLSYDEILKFSKHH